MQENYVTGSSRLFTYMALVFAEAKTAFQEEAGEEPDYDPRIIDYDTAYHHTEMKQLKFQYLELETKEKFLGVVLANPVRYIGREDLAKAGAESGARKQTLRERKERVRAVKQENAVALDELVAESDALVAMERDAAALEAEIAELEAQQAELEAGAWTSGDNTLVQITQLLGTATPASVLEIQTRVRQENAGVAGREREVAAMRRELGEAEAAREATRKAVEVATKGLHVAQGELAEAKRTERESLEGGAVPEEVHATTRTGRWLLSMVEAWGRLVEPRVVGVEVQGREVAVEFVLGKVLVVELEGDTVVAARVGEQEVAEAAVVAANALEDPLRAVWRSAKTNGWLD